MPDGERVRPPRWLKPVNKVFMVLLRLGVPISRVESPVVLTVPGRKTGKPRSTPVTPMDVDGKRYVVEGYPGADWANNVRAADEVTLAQGRRSRARQDGGGVARGCASGAARITRGGTDGCQADGSGSA